MLKRRSIELNLYYHEIPNNGEIKEVYSGDRQGAGLSEPHKNCPKIIRYSNPTEDGDKTTYVVEWKDVKEMRFKVEGNRLMLWKDPI